LLCQKNYPLLYQISLSGKRPAEDGRAIWGNWEDLFAGVQDPRNPNLILCSLNSLLFAGTFLFVCRLGSRREIQAKLRGNGPAQDSFGGLFGIARIPHGDTLFYHPVLEAKLVTSLVFVFTDDRIH